MYMQHTRTVTFILEFTAHSIKIRNVCFIEEPRMCERGSSRTPPPRDFLNPDSGLLEYITKGGMGGTSKELGSASHLIPNNST